MFNLVVLTGRLTAAPELKTTPSGVSVTSFSIANDIGYGDDKKTNFINIVAWRGTAEFISKYFKKGSLIGIEGSIQTRRYTDKNGNKRTAFEVVASNVQFVESQKTDDRDEKYKKDKAESNEQLRRIAEGMKDSPMISSGFTNADTADFADLGSIDEDLPF